MQKLWGVSVNKASAHTRLFHHIRARELMQGPCVEAFGTNYSYLLAFRSSRIYEIKLGGEHNNSM